MAAPKRKGGLGRGLSSLFEDVPVHVEEYVKTTEKAAEWVWEHKKGVAIVAGILLMLAFMLNAMSSCSVFVEGIGGAVVQSSYHASDDAMRDAEAAYVAMEQDRK